MRTIVLVGLLIMSLPVVAKEDIKQLDIREARACIKIAKAMDRTERSVEKLVMRLERLERLMARTDGKSDIQFLYTAYERMIKSMNEQTYFYREKFHEYQKNCNGVHLEKSVWKKTCRNSTRNTFCDMFR